jgi:hypothetical protein
MTNESRMIVSLPPIAVFEGRWLSWEDLTRAFRDPALRQLGAYLVARFGGGSPPSLSLPEQNVVYIGETHGRCASLRQRLTQFGQSAGFCSGGQQNGHYAAWGVPELLGRQIERGQHVDPTGFYFAVVPFPLDPEAPLAEVPDAPGAFPPLVESLLLWQHVLHHGRLPVLNSSGRQRLQADDDERERIRQVVAGEDVRVLLDPAASDERLTEAATRAAHAIAGALGYTRTKVYTSRHSGRSVHRHLGGGAWLYVGQGPAGAGVSIWRGEEDCVFGLESGRGDEGPVATTESFRDLLGRLWDRYR